jgi:hypothetical protein
MRIFNDYIKEGNICCIIAGNINHKIPDNQLILKSLKIIFERAK